MSRDEEAISTLDKELLRLNVLFKENHSMSQRVGYLIRAYTAAIAALQERAERRNPQPLTLEQLRGMVGNPVYVFSTDEDKPSGYGLVGKTRKVEGQQEIIVPTLLCCFEERNYGKTWFAYRSKPETDDTRTKPGYGTGKTLGFINQMMEANT